MKDLIITARRQQTELLIFAVCLLIAFCLNIFAICFYETSWKELWTQLFWVLLIGFGFYVLTILIRGLIFLVKKSIGKN